MAENGGGNVMGKKIFFLYPPASVQNQVITELAQEEFEVYTAKDEAKLRRVLKEYPDSVVFASINEGMKESAWEEWIRMVNGTAETAGVEIGILSPAAGGALEKKYLEQFRINCGYLVLKSDLSLVRRQITEALGKINAKGRRKYIRLVMEEGSNATVNLPLNGAFVNGVIKDISVVGFSCVFPDAPEIAKNTLIENIQIRLQTQLLKAEAIVFGSRGGETEKNYVLLFTQRTSPEVKTRIRAYMQTSLQSRMDRLLR